MTYNWLERAATAAAAAEYCIIQTKMKTTLFLRISLIYSITKTTQ